MPIYEYRCAECGFQDEFLQKVSEPPMTVCPSCGKASFRKLLSAAGFQLKGSGWYATDFKNSGQRAAAAAGPKGETKSAAGSDAPAGSGAKAADAPAAGSKGESKGATDSGTASAAPAAGAVSSRSTN